MHMQASHGVPLFSSCCHGDASMPTSKTAQNLEDAAPAIPHPSLQPRLRRRLTSEPRPRTCANSYTAIACNSRPTA